MDDASMENLSLPGAFNSSPTEQMDITSSDDVTRNHPGPSQTPQSPTEQMDITSSDDDARNHPGPSQTPQLQSQILKPQESGKRKRSDHEEISSRKLIAVEPEYLQELEFAVDELTKKLKSKDKEIKRLQSIEPSVNDLKDAEIRHLRVVEQKVETLIIGKIYISKEKSASDGAYKTLQSQFEDYKRVRFPGFMLSYLRLSIEQDVDRQHKEASRAKEHEMSELEAKFKQQIEELQIHHDRTVEELNKKVESQSLQISSLVEDSLEESETAKILLNEPDGEGSNILEEDMSHIKELEDLNMAFTERITAYEAQIAKLNADLEEQKAESSKLTRAVQELEGQSVDGISKQERITELEALVRAKTTELEELKHSTSHAQDLENRINELQARLGEFEREREGQSIDGISKQERITELEALVRAKTTELEELKHSTSHAQDLENRINELQGSLQESDSEREKLIQAQQVSSHRENVLASELQTVREKRSEQIKTLTAQVRLLENELSGNQTALKDQGQELERLRAASTQRRTADEAEIAKLNADLKALKDSQQSSADRGALDADHIQKLEAQLTAQTNRVQQLEIMNAASIENASAYETRVKQLESDLEAQKAESSKLTRAVQELEGQSVDGISKQERITELEALVRAKTTELEELKHSTSHAQDLENRINELQGCLQESDSEREKLIQAQQVSSHRENVLASELQTMREKRSEQIKTLTAQVRLLENELSGNQTALKDQGQELERLRAASTQRRTADEAEIAKLNADLKALKDSQQSSADRGALDADHIQKLEAQLTAQTNRVQQLEIMNAASIENASAYETRVKQLESDLEAQKAESSKLTRAVQELEGQSVDGISKQERITELEALVRAKTTELEELKHSTSHAQDLENRINELQGCLQESDSEREKLIQAQQVSSHRENVLASELQTMREKRSEQIKTLTAQVRLLENELSGNQTALKDQGQELERLRAASTQRRTADEAEIAKLNADLKALKDSQQSSADRGALDADHIQKLEAQLTAQTNRVQQLEIMNAASIENASAYETRVKQLESDLEAQKAESSKLTRAVQELEGQSVDGISKQERITELEALVRAKTTELEELKHSTSHAQDLENRINELQARLGEFEREREGQSIDGISKQERITELEALVRAKTTELEELKHSTSHAQDLENRINELQARLQESDSEREKLIQAQQVSSHRENVLASELQTVREKRSEQIKTLTAQVRLLENELSGNQTALKDQGQELERLRAASTQRRTADEAEIAKLNADLKDQKAESSRLTRAVQELEGQLTDGIDRENRIVQLNNDLDAKTAELKKSREESTSHAQQLENRIGDLQARLQESDSKREKLIQAQQLSSHRENVFASELQTVREKRSEQIKTLNARVRDLEKELEQAATNSRDSLSKERERYQQMSVEFQKQQAALSQTTEDLSTVKAALEKEFEDHGNTKSLLELLQSDLVDSQKAISILNSQLEATMADHIEFGEEAQDSDSAMDPDAPESTPSATGKSQKAAGKRRQMSMMPDTTLYTLMNHRNGDLQVNMEPENSAERPTFSNFFNQTEFTPTLSTSANRSSPVRDGDLASSSNPGPSIPNRFSKPGHYRRGRATHQSPPPPSSAIPRSGRDDVRGVEASTAFHADTPATVADPSVVPPHSVFSSTPPVTPVPPVASVSAAERAFQERILNTLSTLSSDVRGVVSDVQELRSNANTQPATPRRRIPNRKPYSPYKQAGPNASRQLQQYLLGISEDDDIFIMDSIHIASPAEVDKFENSLRDPPPLEPLQLHFDQVKVKWNAYLADLFAEQFLRLHSNLNATADQIKEHFMARVQMFREKLISIVPRPGETSEQCFDRVREERLNANRRKRRRTRQRNKLYVDRYSNCIDAGRHDIADVVLTLGEDGMSEDETDGEDSTVVLLTQWRNPKLLTPLKIADSLRPATSVNGTRRPGSRPLKRRRLQSAREGYQPAPDQRPENYYYSSWRACLSRYDIALLKMKDAKPFFGE
ncbi:hypothetical protein JR316_0011932 [Psilocybe cubensis]|uniref:Uncharacterized protein n=1 Tax=Psilocybe cubensis TaxID=181762 RepID=A0ACB8GLT2_PSICU|nr:hypothetical protein JR316_0011932 [Psilocybe cubensis]KAH9476357.1 hypothetical protein JR316_0011932 [Psilocybe cubensis]